MKPIIFMFYYVNVNGMPRQAITETMHQLIRNTKIERDDCDIIQQYFPMQHLSLLHI